MPDLTRISPEEVKKYVDNQIRRQTRIITFLIRLVDRLMIFFYVSIIYRCFVSRHTPLLHKGAARRETGLESGPMTPMGVEKTFHNRFSCVTETHTVHSLRDLIFSNCECECD